MDAWQWGIAALVLLMFEMILPGFYLLWVGVAAGIVALLVFVLPNLSLEAQLLVFAAATVASIVSWRAWHSRHPDVSDQPFLNERGQQYVGREFTLDTPIVNGMGRMRVGDGVWKVSGEDLPAGTVVRVVGVDGIVMQVASCGKIGTQNM